jgi:hypothetical protein
MLRVETLAVFELTSRRPVRAALLQELERLASALGCNVVAVAAHSRGYVNHPFRT